MSLQDPKSNRKWLDQFIINEGATPTFGWTASKYEKRTAQAVCLLLLHFEEALRAQQTSWSPPERLAVLCYCLQVCCSLSNALNIKAASAVTHFVPEFRERYLGNSNAPNFDQQAALIQAAMTILASRRRADLDWLTVQTGTLFVRGTQQTPEEKFNSWKQAMLWAQWDFTRDNSKVLLAHGMLGL